MIIIISNFRVLNLKKLFFKQDNEQIRSSIQDKIV